MYMYMYTQYVYSGVTIVRVHPPLLLHILLHLETLQLYPPLPLMFQNLLIGFSLHCLVQPSNVCICLVVNPLLT